MNYRPFRISKTVTLSTVGAYTGYASTFLSGNLQSVYIGISKPVGAGSKVIITTSSTQRAVLTVADPSTLGAFYRPRPLDHGTTGNELTTRGTVWLVNDRLRIKVSSSSGLDGETVETRFIVS